MEQALGFEPTTSKLGIKISAPLFSQLAKPLRKNQRPATHTAHVLPDLRVAAGRLRDGVLLVTPCPFSFLKTPTP